MILHCVCVCLNESKGGIDGASYLKSLSLNDCIDSTLNGKYHYFVSALNLCSQLDSIELSAVTVRAGLEMKM